MASRFHHSLRQPAASRRWLREDTWLVQLLPENLLWFFTHSQGKRQLYTLHTGNVNFTHCTPETVRIKPTDTRFLYHQATLSFF